MLPFIVLLETCSFNYSYIRRGISFGDILLQFSEMASWKPCYKLHSSGRRVCLKNYFICIWAMLYLFMFIYGLLNDSRSKSIYGWRVRRLVNHELEWMWKEVIMAHIQAFTRHVPGGLRKNNGKYQSAQAVSSWDFKPGPHEYEVGALLTWPLRSVMSFNYECSLMMTATCLRF